MVSWPPLRASPVQEPSTMEPSLEVAVAVPFCVIRRTAAMNGLD
jgi:hypothetical protein